MNARLRATAAIVLLPVLGGLLLLLGASAVPVRFDLRTFQMQARLQTLPLPYGGNFLFLSRDNEVRSAEVVSFALPHWSFPRGERAWLTLQETSAGVWAGGFTGIDAEGRFHSPRVTASGWEWVAAAPGFSPAWLPAAVTGWTVLYDSAETRTAFESRLPLLRSAQHVLILPAAERTLLPLGGSRNAVTPARLARLASLLGALCCSVALALALLGSGVETAGVAVVAAMALIGGAAYVAGALHAGAGAFVPLALWSASGAALVARVERLSLPTPRLDWPVFVGLGAYAAVLVLRLDFDGDTYTTYLQVARYYFWRGHHDPHDPGVMGLVQGAVYPPGYSMLIASAMWLADLPRDASCALGTATSLAVLFYRGLVVLLNVAFLAALWGRLATVGGTAAAGIAGVAGALLLVPSLRGMNMSAETLIVPLFGTALLAISAGRERAQPALAGLGFFVAGIMTLVKLDGMPYIALLVLPWAVAAWGVGPRWGWRLEGGALLGLGAGLLPALVWRATGPAANQSFHSLDPRHILAGLPAVGAAAFKILVKSELWLAVLVCLPAAVAWVLYRRQSPWRLMAPVGVCGITVFWILIYCLSTLGGTSHVETSFARIMLAPALTAWLFALQTLLSSPAAVPAVRAAA